MTYQEGCSFDLTEFNSDGWIKICEALELSDKGQVARKYGEDCEEGHGPFVWRCRRGNLTILTYNHPVTGAYYEPSTRKCQPGYASYIGAFGDENLVRLFYGLVFIHAKYVKDSDANERRFA